jgi:DNA-binding IclR family transcriptional regulator
MTEDGVKSARRVFEILEHFAQVQRELSVVDVARQLGYPQSSASALMRTMAELGYLHYDTSSRTYRPTARLPLLVGWIGPRLFREGRMVELMNELSQATGETIILGAENGLQVRYIHVIEATGPLRLHSVAGSLRPYTRSAIGLALLGTHDDQRVGRIVRRLNSEDPDPSRHVTLPELLKRLGEIRRQGYALSTGGIVKGGGALAIVLPERVNGTPLAVAIAGAEGSVLANHAEWVAIMREAIERAFAERGAEG